MSSSEQATIRWDDMNDTYPRSLDDPARSFVYREYYSDDDHLQDWLSNHETGHPPKSAKDPILTFLSQFMIIRYPEWITQPDSDLAKQCAQACLLESHRYTHQYLVEQVRDLSESPKHLSFKLMPSELSKSEEELADVYRAINFCDSLRNRWGMSCEPINPPSAWPILYNSFFEDLRADYGTLDAEFDIEYCPRWCLRAGHEKIFTPLSSVDFPHVTHLVPDAVVFVRAPKFFPFPSVPRLLEEQYMIHYNSSLIRHLSCNFSVPLLVVEYVKTNADADHGREAHLALLKFALASACGLYRSLKLFTRFPVFGLLVDRIQAILYAASDADEERWPALEGIRYDPMQTFDMTNTRDALILRLFLAKLIKHGREDLIQAVESHSEILEEDLTNGRTFCWRSEGVLDALNRNAIPTEPLRADVSSWAASVENIQQGPDKIF